MSVLYLTVKLLSLVRHMAFRPPSFNLTVSLWHNLGSGKMYTTPDETFLAVLSPGKRTLILASSPSLADAVGCMELLCPKGTDIRAFWNGVPQDVVEVPAGSTRFYNVVHVDDVAKGFGNEYRLALLAYAANGVAAPAPGFNAPVPLP